MLPKEEFVINLKEAMGRLLLGTVVVAVVWRVKVSHLS